MNARPIHRLFHLWFGLAAPVGRAPYAATGLALACVKYGGDATLLAMAGVAWRPWSYLLPGEVVGAWSRWEHPWALSALLLWTLPFLWIGASMTVRRAIDAGLGWAVGLLFFVPWLNYVLMLVLCFLPSGERHGPPSVGRETRLSVARAVLVGAGLLLGMIALSIYGAGSYGLALFVGSPLAAGYVTAYLYNARVAHGFGATLEVVLVVLSIAAAALLVFALEGAACLLMAAPLLVGVGTLGALLGWAMARAPGRRWQATAALLPPLLLAFDLSGAPAALHEVRSSVVVDAPPATVWEHVLDFPELPPPERWLFRLGIAYPLRARLVGRGVGALRYCEFSTGPFVEPITAWEAPSRLAFDVAAQPLPMTELTPYREIWAPHLRDGLRVERGEFRLVDLGDGRTRLEGSTWYRLEMFPQGYWTLWSDTVIRGIHHRVLEHIRRQAEGEGNERPAPSR